MFGGDEQIIYWTCESNTVLKEELIVPATNIAKERALVIAAQKGMSTIELLRRHVTDTLTSSTVTAAVAELKLSEGGESARPLISTGLDSDVQDDVAYEVEVSSKYFHAPGVLYMSTVQSKTDLTSKQLDKETGNILGCFCQHLSKNRQTINI